MPDPLSPNTRPGKWPHGQLRISLFLVVLCLSMFAAGGQEPPKLPLRAAAPAETWQNFEGNLTAAGTRQVLAMGSAREAKIVYFSGSLLLTHEEGLSRGFRIEMVGFDDGAGLSVGSCVWTDERGDKVFSDMKAESFGTAMKVAGTITGGTGRYAGLAGEYGFVWKYVVQEADGTIQGRAVGLKGKYRRAPVAQGKGAP